MGFRDVGIYCIQINIRGLHLSYMKADVDDDHYGKAISFVAYSDDGIDMDDTRSRHDHNHCGEGSLHVEVTGDRECPENERINTEHDQPIPYRCCSPLVLFKGLKTWCVTV